MHVWVRWLLFLMLLASCLTLRCLFSDDTVYAPGYSASRFRSIRVGMPREDVIRLLGQPLSIDRAPGYIQWDYAPKDWNPQPQANGPITPPPITSIRADLSGKIVSVYGGGAYIDIKEGEFLGHPLDEVRKRFGDPLEIHSAPDRDYYWYSKMDGIKGHFVRNVQISTEGIVCDISAGCIGYYVGPEDERNLSWIEWLEIHF